MTRAEEGGVCQRLTFLLRTGRNSDVERLARELIAREPEWGYGYTYLSRALEGLGRTSEAVEPALVGIIKNPDDPWALIVYGDLEVRCGRPERGLDAIRRAIRSAPEYTGAHTTYARALSRLKRDADALEAAVQGLTQDPTNAELHFLQGWALVNLGRHNEALQVAAEAIRLHPRYASLYYLRAVVLCDRARSGSWIGTLRDRWEAASAYQQAIRLEPSEDQFRRSFRANALEARTPIVQFLVVSWYVVVALVAVLVGVLGAVPIMAGISGILWAALGVRMSRMIALHEAAVLWAPLWPIGFVAPSLDPTERYAGRRAVLGTILTALLPLIVVGLALLAA